MEYFYQVRNEEVVADAGYESLEDYLYLDYAGQTCLIKPANHDQKKRKNFKKQIGRIENMSYDPVDDCFTCTQGRKLPLCRDCTEMKDGQFVTSAWYRCENCSGCPCRSQCCRAKDAAKPKQLVLQKSFGKRESRQRKRFLRPEASICAYAAPFRRKAPSPCSKRTLRSADS